MAENSPSTSVCVRGVPNEAEPQNQERHGRTETEARPARQRPDGRLAGTRTKRRVYPHTVSSLRRGG